MMGFCHRKSSSSPPAGSNSGQAAISTPRSSPPQQGPSGAAGQNSGRAIDAPAQELFDSQAGTFGVWMGTPLETGSPAPEEFYRSTSTYRAMAERQAPALSRRPATPYPTLMTSQQHPATVPLIRGTFMGDQIPPSIDNPPRFPLAPSRHDLRDFNREFGQEIQRPAVMLRQPGPFPAPTTVPLSAAERQNLRPIRPHQPRLPADYRAETPFSWQQPLSPLPLVTAPNPNTITLHNRHYNGLRVGGVELENTSIQRVLASGEIARRSVWPEERREIQKELLDMTMNLARAEGVVEDEDREGGHDLQIEVDGKKEKKKKKKKVRFRWLKKWFKKQPPS
ncbi:hypothetical protein HBI75_059990 [Parastagonospora nodorum]|nr:hypothetical protein HBI75_059990 [Parastagonospora nodorum]